MGILRHREVRRLTPCHTAFPRSMYESRQAGWKACILYTIQCLLRCLGWKYPFEDYLGLRNLNHGADEIKYKEWLIFNSRKTRAFGLGVSMKMLLAFHARPLDSWKGSRHSFSRFVCLFPRYHMSCQPSQTAVLFMILFLKDVYWRKSFCFPIFALYFPTRCLKTFQIVQGFFPTMLLT